MEDDFENVWRKCSSCKKPIGFGGKHFVCSVSTCNAQRTGYVFCSVVCFERHLPGARHKDAAAIDATAPGKLMPQKRIVSSEPSVTAAARPGATTLANNEVLVIASRLKDYIQDRSEFSTSGNVMDVLSRHLRALCDRAIDNARASGRKTVMDRDFDFLKK